MTPWVCPLCGQAGKRTREHVWPKWLADLFGVRLTPVKMQTELTTPALDRWSRGFDLVIWICQTCNNDWLSDLEAEMKAAFSEEILIGNPRTIPADQLTLLARWAAKTALFLNILMPNFGGLAYMPDGHLAELSQGVPRGTVVWLGVYDPSTYFTRWWMGRLDPIDSPPDAGELGLGSAYVCLFHVGHLLFQVLGGQPGPANTLLIDGVDENALHAIWPLPESGNVDWPDTIPVDDKWCSAYWPPKNMTVQSLRIVVMI